MTKTTRLKVEAKASMWGGTDGSQTPIVRIYGGAKKSIGVDYDELPRLIAELAALHHEHLLKQQGNNS